MTAGPSAMNEADQKWPVEGSDGGAMMENGGQWRVRGNGKRSWDLFLRWKPPRGWGTYNET